MVDFADMILYSAPVNRLHRLLFPLCSFSTHGITIFDNIVPAISVCLKTHTDSSHGDRPCLHTRQYLIFTFYIWLQFSNHCLCSKYRTYFRVKHWNLSSQSRNCQSMTQLWRWPVSIASLSSIHFSQWTNNNPSVTTHTSLLKPNRSISFVKKYKRLFFKGIIKSRVKFSRNFLNPTLTSSTAPRMFAK